MGQKEQIITVDVAPKGSSLEVLSQLEIQHLREASQGKVQELFRRCALAVLNTGHRQDDAAAIFEQHKDFDIQLVPRTRGIKLRIINPPPQAFVDGKIIEGIKGNLFAVLRDVVFITNRIETSQRFELDQSESLTNLVFHILRNASVFEPRRIPNVAVCWGGHSIDRIEYDYTKEVGYQLGLRGVDICTGCGPGAMKGPMKGATIGHAKQRVNNPRYIGISEPGIIAAESPNPIVNNLVIMPDIEKRLEAFVRFGHAFLVFPGGVGTAEEILFLLGILMHPENRDKPFPLILSGPEKSEDYFRRINELLVNVLGEEVKRYYQIIIGDPELVARSVVQGLEVVKNDRRIKGDAYYYNWLLKIPFEFQFPFRVTHENMASLSLHRRQEPHALAANLRQAFSGIVAGNVKEYGIRAIREKGPFEINGDLDIMQELDTLLKSFIAQKRMVLDSEHYTPCYRIQAQ